MATFAVIVGIKLLDSAGEDSFSMLSLLQNDHSKFNRPPIIYHNTKGKRGIRVDNWVYIDAPSGAVDQDPDWFKKERGVIDDYAHGNEPYHHVAYLYNYVDEPWKTQKLIHQNYKEFYKAAPDGYMRNEDGGQMSAWYVFSEMDFIQ